MGMDEVRAAVEQAIDEEFCHTYGGEDIAARVLDILVGS